MSAKSLQSYPTPCDPKDFSPPGSAVHGILQARILKWVAIPSSRGSFPNQGSNQGLPLCRRFLYRLSYQGSYVYVCMSLYTGMCVYVCLCIWVCVCMHYGYVYVCMSLYMRMCMYACICIWICICMHVSVYGYMYVCMYLYMGMCMYACACSVLFDPLQLPWTVTCQAPLSMEFLRQEYWSGLPFSSPKDLPDLGIEHKSLASPALAGGFFTTCASWEAPYVGVILYSSVFQLLVP